jgi:hypothetical protein
MSILMEMVQTSHKRRETSQVDKASQSSAQTARQLIDLYDREKIMYWCRRLGATPMQLCSAVEEVGADATVVQRLLRMR